MKRKTVAPPPQPPAAQLRREGRLARIAKALASGATVTDIAEAEGISRTIASRHANSPEWPPVYREVVSSEHDEKHPRGGRARSNFKRSSEMLGTGRDFVV